MFALQASQLRGAKSLDELAQILAGCGPIERNVLEGQFRVFGPRDTNQTLPVVQIEQPNLESPAPALKIIGRTDFQGPVHLLSSTATASAKWTNVAAPGVPYVDATDDATGKSVRIYLPRTAEKDPNVRQGDKLFYVYSSDGKAYAISNYLDDKIGTIKMWGGSLANIPPGWALCDGTSNAAGSGIDLTDKFIRAGTGIGTTGGTAQHTHAAHIGISTDIATTGVKVDINPPDHNHGIPNMLEMVEAGGTNAISIRVLTADWTDLTSLTAQVTDSGHAHTVPDLAHDTVNHEPPYVVLAFIERID